MLGTVIALVIGLGPPVFAMGSSSSQARARWRAASNCVANCNVWMQQDNECYDDPFDWRHPESYQYQQGSRTVVGTRCVCDSGYFQDFTLADGSPHCELLKKEEPKMASDKAEDAVPSCRQVCEDHAEDLAEQRQAQGFLSHPYMDAATDDCIERCETCDDECQDTNQVCAVRLNPDTISFTLLTNAGMAYVPDTCATP